MRLNIAERLTTFVWSTIRPRSCSKGRRYFIFRFCYIDFRKRDSVISAMKMNGKDINGRKIYVDFETSQAK